jgi:hypothetical protein
MECTPGSSGTTGTGAGRLFDASPDVMDRTANVLNSQSFSAADFGGATGTNVMLARFGDPNTTITSNYKVGYGQFRFDAQSTMPSLAFVDKNPAAGNFPLVAVLDAWT